jgi:hypothetical protein
MMLAPGMYDIRIVAKSGNPEKGQTDVNSSVSTVTTMSFPGYSYGNVSSTETSMVDAAAVSYRRSSGCVIAFSPLSFVAIACRLNNIPVLAGKVKAKEAP